jgi:hypothetical protein
MLIYPLEYHNTAWNPPFSLIKSRQLLMAWSSTSLASVFSSAVTLVFGGISLSIKSELKIVDEKSLTFVASYTTQHDVITMLCINAMLDVPRLVVPQQPHPLLTLNAQSVGLC